MKFNYLIGGVFLFVSSVISGRNPDIETAYKLLIQEQFKNGRTLSDNFHLLKAECDISCAENGILI